MHNFQKYFSKFFHNTRSGFTLLELVVVIGIVAILGTISVLVLNPAQIFKQTRDANRITDIQNINQSLIYFQSAGGSSFGSANTIYVSLPDSSATCANIGLPTPPLGWSYVCQPTASYQSVDGTGWIPVDFTTVQQTVGTLFSSLPIDPVNTLSGDYYYTYIVGSWTLSATMESTKYLNSVAANDGGCVDTRFETGNDLALNCNITAGGGLSNAKAITAFSFASPAATGVVTEGSHTVAITVPNGTVVTALVPTISISALASVSPLSGSAQNFTSPVTYTVTAENATTQDYIVTVTEEAPACTSGNQTFSYTGAQQTLVIGEGCTTITVDAVGASGSDVFWGRSGGKGGRSQGNITVTPGETLYIYVGGKGLKSGDAGAPGGYNGGGIGGGWGAGGGASDVRQGGTALTDRVIVAGGGASAGSQINGGDGGGTTGGSALYEAKGATGGTQSAGGSGSGGGTAGSLGQGGTWGSSQNAFGGGGGYYGGGAVGNDGLNAGWGGGGGGSSLVPGGGSTTSGYGSLNSHGSVYISW